MEGRVPYDDFPVVFLPPYESPPAWVPPHEVIPNSDAHRAGLQEGVQVLSVNDVDFQDIEHSKAVEILRTAREIMMHVRYFPCNYQRQKERTVH